MYCTKTVEMVKETLIYYDFLLEVSKLFVTGKLRDHFLCKYTHTFLWEKLKKSYVNSGGWCVGTYCLEREKRLVKDGST